jgi:hypothetical protein
MRWSDPLLRASLAMIVASPVVRAAPKGASNESPPPSPEAVGASTSKSPKPVVATPSALGGLDRLLPVGRTAEGVKLPSLNEEGRLVSLTRIDKVTRLDEENFGLEGLKMVSFENEKVDLETGKPLPTSTMVVRSGTYHAPSKTLKSDQPCTMSKPEFDLSGDSLIYRSAEGVGIMKGNVKMIIHHRKPTQKEPTP